MPRLIQIKGSVRDETGKPLSGNLRITFTLYKDANDQVAVWQENQNVQLDSAGRYTVLLGATNDAGLPLEIFSTGEARWLGVRPDGQAEQPRILFLSVAYALKAADAETLGGKPASAFALAGSQYAPIQVAAGTAADAANSGSGLKIPTVGSGAGPLLVSIESNCSPGVNSNGVASPGTIALFTDGCDVDGSVIFQSSGGNIGIGNISPAGLLDVSGTAFVRGLLSASGGAILPPTGTATTSPGLNSQPLDLQASAWNGAAVTQDFQWLAEPTGISNPSGTLNLRFGAGTTPIETGLSIGNTGVINFVSGQTFPGTVTSVGTGAGLTGGPINGTNPSGTISIPTAGVSNSMLANSSLTVTAGSGLSGGGPISLGGNGTLNIAPNGVTNAMLANSSLTVGPTVGGGLTGGGSVSLGGSTTLGLMSCLANQVLQWGGTAWLCAANGSGGTVTSVTAGNGLTGGPITTTGALSLNTSFTDARYLQLAGGTLGGPLNFLQGAVFPPLGTANTSQGYPSSPLDLEASTYFPSLGPATYVFRWQAGPVGNNSASVKPGASLNLLYGVPGDITQVLSVAGNGVLNFAPGQTYPGLFATNAQTSTYTTTTADFATCATIPVASGTFTITLVASSSQPANGQCVFIINYGSGAVTIAGNGQHLNGVTSSLTLTPGSATTPNGAFIVSDGTNYEAQLFGGGGGNGGSGTVTGVGLSINGSSTTSGIFAVNSGGTNPVTTSGTLNISLSGTSGSIPYFSSSSVLKSSAALTGILRGGSPPTASEISGDAITSGSNALTVKGLNGVLLSGLATGLLKNTTGVPSIATSSDIVGLFTGCSGTLYLGADGKCHAASGSGTVTRVATGTGLTASPSPITTTGTISLMSCTSSGQTLLWNGTSWGCATSGGGGLSGMTDGITYFSSNTTLTSTPAPTNGQILIGSTGGVPVLGTLTAGPNVSITNGPGSITISAAGSGGSGTILPFFATGGERTGANQPTTKNVNKLWGFLLPYSVTTTQVTYDVTTADNTANNYDIGIYNSSGNLLLDIGAMPGTTFAPAKKFLTFAWVQGSTTLPAGRYYIGFTTNCASACGAVGGDTAHVSFAVNLSAGTSVGGALATAVTLPADTWNTGNQPTFVIH